MRATGIKRTTDLYFEIEKHFALGGEPLIIPDLMRMANLKSTSTAKYYRDILVGWGLITYIPYAQNTIVLAPKKHYPPVEYRDLKGVHVGTRK